MSNHELPSTNAQRVCARVTMTCGVIAVTVAAVVLFGWAAGIPIITSVAPGFATMKPNTALCFILLGTALVVRARPRSRRLEALGKACALGTFLISGLTLQEHWLGVDLGIDTLLLPSGTVSHDTAHPGRMAVATACAHSMAAVALVLLGRRTARVAPSEILGLVTGTIGLTATLGYLFGASQLYDFHPFASVALPTALLFMIVATGVIAAAPSHHAVSTLTSPYLGGRVSRRILCYAVVGPVLINWLAVRAGIAGMYAHEITTALCTVVAVLATSLVALAAGGWINRADEQRQTIARQQAAMMRELDHRVKNNLASVLALTSLTIDNARSLDDFRGAFVGRIRALARAHEALAASRWEGVRIFDVVRLSVGPYAGGRRRGQRPPESADSSHERFLYDGPDVLLPAAVSSSVCATLHELATNAAKYGAFSVPDGQVRVQWSVSPAGELTLVWREFGVPSIQKPDRTGFGTDMITGAVVHEMQGDVQFEYAPPGLTCRIRVPIRAARVDLRPEPATFVRQSA